MIAHPQDKKNKPEGGVQQFSAASRDYFRVDMAHGLGGRHESIICTSSNGHLLVWNGGAQSDKGMAAIIDTLGSISSSPAPDMPKGAQSTEMKEHELQDPISVPRKVKVARGVTQGLLIKRVNPSYPEQAREAWIQGTVVLRAEISKEGDIAGLELVSGPIELAGSAVSAVRKWKYNPYMLDSERVAVLTEITVNYQLR